jgi:hypothetical protein
MAEHDELPDEEIARRRDEVVKRMLATPPQTRKPKEGRGAKPAPQRPS